MVLEEHVGADPALVDLVARRLEDRQAEGRLSATGPRAPNAPPVPLTAMGTLAKPKRGGIGVATTVSLVVIALSLFGLLVFGVITALDPFGSETVDRSGPALLERIQKLEEFTAAEANFTQDVDLEEDANYLPDFIKGERVTALVTGQVRATVDFGQLDEDRDLGVRGPLHHPPGPPRADPERCGGGGVLHPDRLP